MIRGLLKHIANFICWFLLVTTLITGAYISTQESLESFTEEEIDAVENVGVLLSHTEQQTVILSRQSAVQVMSLQVSTGATSVSSGTYVKYKDNYFVLTTSHGILGPCLTTQIIVDDVFYNCVQLVLEDPQADYTLIRVEELIERTPVQIPAQIPHRNEWIKELATMNTVYYTGYPNNGGPYTFDGKIVAYNTDEAVFIDSYGWSGSSGAGVFSASGNLIGYIMALEVGETYFGRQVLENFVWVIPLFKVNWIAADALVE